MKKSLVMFGGVLGVLLILGCSSSPPSLNIDLESSNLYAGYKGGAARDGFVAYDDSGMISPMWQLKFKYPLFYSPSSAGDYIFLPGIDKKIHVIEVNTGVEVAEIKLKRPAGTTPELADSFMAICEEGGRTKLLVFNYISGKFLWSVNTSRLCLPPALYDNKIFWVDGKNRVNAANLRDGLKLWSVTLDSGFDVGPILSNNHLVVASRNKHLYSFDTQTGKIIWEITGPGRTNSSPASSDGKLYYCISENGVVCHDSNDGRLIWRFDDSSRIFYSPVVDKEAVYYGNGEGRFIKLDKNDGHKLWEFKADIPVRGTALLTSKMVIFSSLDGTVYLLDKLNGIVIESYVAEGMISAAPVLFGNKLLIAAQDKYLYCFYMKKENE